MSSPEKPAGTAMILSLRCCKALAMIGPLCNAVVAYGLRAEHTA